MLRSHNAPDSPSPQVTPLLHAIFIAAKLRQALLILNQSPYPPSKSASYFYHVLF